MSFEAAWRVPEARLRASATSAAERWKSRVRSSEASKAGMPALPVPRTVTVTS